MNNNPTRLSHRHSRLAGLSSWLLVAALLLAACGPSSQPPTGSGAEAIVSKPDLVVAVIPDGDLSELVAGNTAFATDLYQAIRGQPGNLFFSPFSISQTLAMTYAGARGETESQMAKTLHYTLEQDRLHPAFNALDQKITGLAEGNRDQPAPLELRIANAVWAQENYPLLPAYLDLLTENYGAGVRPVNFAGAPEPSRVTINDWVAEQTNQRILNLLPEGAIDPLTRLVLTNAIYFKAPWANPFQKNRTVDGPFTLLDGSEVKAPMMATTALFGYVTGDGYQAVELPHNAETTSMVILLPDAGRFEEVEAGLTGAKLDKILSGLDRQEIALSMPKFTFNTDSISLADTLAAMGMPAAFREDQADFSNMDGTLDLHLSDVVYKAFIAVDEEGSEAAAASAAVMTFRSVKPQPLSVIVDRPFIFLIRDMQTGTVLFLGRVMDPTV